MALTPCSQGLLFAGRPLLVNTNSPEIARYAADFLPQNNRGDSTTNCATITIHLRDRGESCQKAPWFRARGHFAFAQFTHADYFWFNLRTREVYGVCTPDLAADSWCWRAHILPALLGILSAVVGVAPVHAACLVREGRGALLTGHSGSGKSTLSLFLARRGYALLSDEWTYLAADCSGITAWGLPVPLKLLPDATRFFSQLLNHRPVRSLNGEIAYEVLPEEAFDISRDMSCSVKTIMLLERGGTAGCTITPIGAAEALEHLTREVEPLDGSLASSYEYQRELIRSVEPAECLRVSFNDHPSAVAAALNDILAGMH